MEKKQNVPALRFQGFSGEWKERKIEDMAGIAYGGGTPSTQYAAFWQGTIPWIQSSDVIEDDFWDISPRKYISKEAVKYSAAKVIPKNSIAIIIRVGVGKLAFLPFDYATSQDFLSLSRLKIDERFGTYAIWKGINADAGLVQGTSIKGIEREEVLAKIIKVPVAENEAKQVGNFFYHFDQKIRETKRKIQKLQQFRQAMLTKLFPQDGVGKPELYFEGGLNCWKAFCLEDCAERLDNLRVPVSATNRIAGTTPYYGANGIQDYVSGYTHEGEFILIAEDGANDLDNYPIQYVNGKIWVNNHAHVLQGKTKIADTKFLKYALSQVNMRFYLVGGSRSKLNSNIMMNIELKLPIDINEQRKIGDFLGNLDRYISLQQKKLERMQRLKAALLEKLFV